MNQTKAQRYKKHYTLINVYSHTDIYINENTHFSFSNMHCAFSNRGQIFSIPVFLSLFPLRSSSIRFEGFELNAEVRAAQPAAVILLLFSLQRKKTKTGNSIRFLSNPSLINNNYSVMERLYLPSISALLQGSPTGGSRPTRGPQ